MAVDTLALTSQLAPEKESQTSVGGILPALFPRSASLKSFNSRARDERINKISRFLLYNNSYQVNIVYASYNRLGERNRTFFFNVSKRYSI